MLQTGDIIRIREYIEIPVEHKLWDERAARYFRSHEQDLEEGLFPGFYQVVESVRGGAVVLASVRIGRDTNIIIPVGDDRFLVHGAKAIDTLERSIKRSVKDWRPEMGASNPPSDIRQSMGIMIRGGGSGYVFVRHARFVESGGGSFSRFDGFDLGAGKYVVLDYIQERSVLTLGYADWDSGEPAQRIYPRETIEITGKREIEGFLGNTNVVLHRRIAGKKEWRPEMGIARPDRSRLFEPGAVQGTPKAIEALERAGQAPVELLERHLSGDWGDAHHDDVRENRVALKTRDRIIGVYTLSTGKTIVIITDPGHEMTTIMMPGEF